MRYVYQEPVITTVSDEEISENEAIIALLNSFKDNQQSVAIEFRDPEFPESVKILDNVRILSVSEAAIDIHAFFSQSSAKYKGIPLHNVTKVRLIANKQAIGRKYRVNRWHLLDVAEISEGV